MTLFKQMALLTSMLLLLLLGTVIVVTFSNATGALEKQFYEDAQNTASSLSLSLGSVSSNETDMSTMINANFDSGHYTRIALYDMDNILIYERIGEHKDHHTPEWFTNIIPITIPVASVQVSAGWSPIGVLQVQSDSTYAYASLYSQLIRLSILFLILAAIGLTLLYFVLHIVLRPLTKIQQQAEAIMQNEFIHQDEIPATTEFKDVVKAMNSMVIKVQDIFDRSDKAMHHNHELLYKDTLTGLHNRRYLMMRFPEYIGEETAYEHGTLMLFAFHGALEANKVIGHQNVDILFGKIGKTVKDKGRHIDDSIAARVNGTEFMLLLPGCLGSEGLRIALRIIRTVQNVLKEQGLDDKEIFNITAGVIDYDREKDMATILSGVDYALSKANHLTDEQIYLDKNHKSSTVMGKEAWRNIITDALEEDRFRLDFWPVFDARSKKVHHKEISFTLLDDEQNLYTYGKFIAPVITLGLLAEVYMNIIRQILHTSASDAGSPVCSLRLPADFFYTPNITLAIEPLFEAHADTLAIDLIFGIPERFIATNMELSNSFITLFKRFGFGVGIYQFTGESEEYAYLKELRPAYLKADASFLLDQDQQSMSSLQIITDSLGIDLIATGITERKEVDGLGKSHIHTIQGPLAENYMDSE